jgi:outer membrane lipoprotein-sorting protein
MRHLIMFSLLILLLVAVQFSKAQSVDEIINKHLEAIGGKIKLAALKSLNMEGKISLQGMEIKITTTILNNIGSRTDIIMPGVEDGYQVLTTKSGWTYMPFQGNTTPQETSADEVAFSQTNLDIQCPLLNYKEKGHIAELVGKEKLDDMECYKIKLTSKSGKDITMYIDAATYYKVKTLSKIKPNDEMEVETTFSDFKKNPEGYTFPYSQTTSNGTLIFSHIEINKPVDEKIFVLQ